MQNEVNKSITIIILLSYYSLITWQTGASKKCYFRFANKLIANLNCSITIKFIHSSLLPIHLIKEKKTHKYFRYRTMIQYKIRIGQKLRGVFISIMCPIRISHNLHHKCPRTRQLKLKKVVIFRTHYNFFSQLQFFQQFYIWTTIFPTIFLEKSLWKSLYL